MKKEKKLIEINPLPENLLGCDNYTFECKIYRTETKGVITVEDGEVFFCQNETNGRSCENKKGYKFSWNVYYGSSTNLVFNHISDLRIFKPITEAKETKPVKPVKAKTTKMRENKYFRVLTGCYRCEKVNSLKLICGNAGYSVYLAILELMAAEGGKLKNTIDLITSLSVTTGEMDKDNIYLILKKFNLFNINDDYITNNNEYIKMFVNNKWN